MPWVETDSPSFTARHDSRDADAAQDLLSDLERFRSDLERDFERVPGDVTVVVHPRPLMLSLAHPWLPLAAALSAPAARRYYAGWFGSGEIHVLAPAALERRASGGEGSAQALALSARHEYAHLVVGANNPGLPPPFTPGTFRRYARMTWLAEGAAVHFGGQTPHLRAAVVRRLREGGRPSFPPAARDALLLGGTVFGLLEAERGRPAAVQLAEARNPDTARQTLEELFGHPLARVERAWNDYLEAFAAG